MTTGFRHKKHLGQNFLIDPRVPGAIAEAAELALCDRVLEIGPGEGVLTRELASRAGQVVAVEVDTRLASKLEALQAQFMNLRIVWADFLQTSFPELGLEEDGCKVVANIPYYITTPILMKLLHADHLERHGIDAQQPRPERILLMVQEEVADRILAAPGSKDYGSLSIICQYAAEVSRVLAVPRSAFKPRPQVDSAVIMLRPRSTPPVDTPEPARFFKLVRAAFQQRRKTLLNALAAAGYEKPRLLEAMEGVGIDPGRRGETLSLGEFAQLSRRLGA